MEQAHLTNLLSNSHSQQWIFSLIERLKVFNVFTNPIVVLDRRRHNDISFNEFIIFYQRQSTVRRIFVMLWC